MAAKGAGLPTPLRLDDRQVSRAWSRYCWRGGPQGGGGGKRQRRGQAAAECDETAEHDEADFGEPASARLVSVRLAQAGARRPARPVLHKTLAA